MNYVQGIQDLFDNVNRYIELIIDYLKIDEFRDMLIYLYNCIPEPIHAVLILSILLFSIVGFVKAFRN